MSTRELVEIMTGVTPPKEWLIKKPGEHATPVGSKNRMDGWCAVAYEVADEMLKAPRMNSYLSNPQWQKVLAKLQADRSKKNCVNLDLQSELLWQCLKNRNLITLCQLMHGRPTNQ